ncbi:ATP-dependent RNA helicase RhlE [Aquimixticola soesokkakensis]|uniref:ATP-dependent RNA helicase RhlE n=1 Tax=Aquimixticola soesokkakensis TaxID=1519096 RepID=A0A1Y5RP00_9RHOB|nr:DEAD/DEAH box helicase [Aquimixticola soesokkakensis]SLN20794.1 ATP-dependent RNA helicase RhlE [Aquimixticola soesokkakensis]
MTDFTMLGLQPRLLKVLADNGIDAPTPIQARAIPEVMNGRDVMGLAQTGTGKTLAFGLPLLDLLMKAGSKPAPKTARALILAPTRELVNQIADNLFEFVNGTHLKMARVVGGAGINPQIKRLERGTDILVATPGRLIDLIDRRAVSLHETSFLVLDEADQMLDLGFIHALRKLVPLLAKERQTMLFSATMNKQMAEIAGAFLTSPIRIEVSTPGKVADKVEQEIHFVPQAYKREKLEELIKEHRDELALVFLRTKHGAERLMKQLTAAGFSAGSIHGNKSQGQRERTLKSFRNGELKILVATDVAARGIDIPDVRHVYNFDLPNVPENYVHRIGRTARAGREGKAVAFCAAEEVSDLRAIEKVMGISIPVASGRAPLAEEIPAKKSGRGGRGGGGRGHGGGHTKQGGGQKSGGNPAGRTNAKPRRPQRARRTTAA